MPNAGTFFCFSLVCLNVPAAFLSQPLGFGSLAGAEPLVVLKVRLAVRVLQKRVGHKNMQLDCNILSESILSSLLKKIVKRAQGPRITLDRLDSLYITYKWVHFPALYI